MAATKSATIIQSTAEEQLQRRTESFHVAPKKEFNVVRYFPDVHHQTFIGFGGAITQASAHVYNTMAPELKQRVLNLYFAPDVGGYSLCRIPIQSCDFSPSSYSYVRNPLDTTCKEFDLSKDEEELIPLLLDIQACAPSLEFFSTPWSPPAFMKTNLSMKRGGHLRKHYYRMWAHVIVRYLKGYTQRGINITRLSIQNEPEARQTWESCLMSPQDEALLARSYVKLALDDADMGHIKLFCWDHNKDHILDRVNQTMRLDGSNDTFSGIAFHWYTGDHFDQLAQVAHDYADKELIMTEACVEYSNSANSTDLDHAERYAHEIIGDLKSGVQGFIDWNVLLDSTGGPNHRGNFCEAPLMYDEATSELTIHLSYYYIRHFSEFIQPDSKIVLTSSFTDLIECVGAIDESGNRTLVVLNKSPWDHEISVCEKDEVLDLNIKGHSIVTIRW